VVPPYYGYDRGSYYRYPPPLPIPPLPTYYTPSYGYHPRPAVPDRGRYSPPPEPEVAPLSQWGKERSDRLHISFKEVDTIQELLSEMESDLSTITLNEYEQQLIDDRIKDDFIKQYSFATLKATELTRHQRAFVSHLSQAHKESYSEDLIDPVIHLILTSCGFSDDGLQFQVGVEWNYQLEKVKYVVKPDYIVFRECEDTGLPAYSLLVDLCKSEDRMLPEDGGQSRIAARLLGMAISNFKNGIIQPLYGIFVCQLRIKLFTVDFPPEYITAILSEGNIETEIEIKQLPAEQLDPMSQQLIGDYLDLLSSRSRADLIKYLNLIRTKILIPVKNSYVDNGDQQ